MTKSEFPYEDFPFPVVHDANSFNGYHPDEYCMVQSLRPAGWKSLPSSAAPSAQPKALWFDGNIAPEYLTALLQRPYGTPVYPELRLFRGPDFPVGSILESFAKNCLAVSLQDINKVKRYHFKKSLFTLNNPNSASSIEHVSHRVWLTNPESSSTPPEWAVDFYLKSVERNPDLDHFFWCLDKEKIPDAIKKLQASPVKINIKEVKEVKHLMETASFFDLLMQQGYYVMACDVLRLELLKLHGGIYTDFGYEFRSNITPLLDNFDMVTNQFVGPNPLDTHCDTNILAAKKANPIIVRFLKFMADLDKVRVVKKEICEVYKDRYNLCNPWTHGPYFSAFLYSSLRPSDKLLVLSGYDNVVWKNHMGTWWASTHGNKSIAKDGYPVI